MLANDTDERYSLCIIHKHFYKMYDMSLDCPTSLFFASRRNRDKQFYVSWNIFQRAGCESITNFNSET